MKLTWCCRPDGCCWTSLQAKTASPWPVRRAVQRSAMGSVLLRLAPCAAHIGPPQGFVLQVVRGLEPVLRVLHIMQGNNTGWLLHAVTCQIDPRVLALGLIRIRLCKHQCAQLVQWSTACNLCWPCMPPAVQAPEQGCHGLQVVCVWLDWSHALASAQPNPDQP